MATGQVVFLNTLYYPTHEEFLRLEYIQEQMELYHAELALQSRELNDYQKFVFKQSSHNNIRKSWRLEYGGKE
jgi:hypothetical protein